MHSKEGPPLYLRRVLHRAAEPSLLHDVSHVLVRGLQLCSLPERFLHSAQSRFELFHRVPNSYPNRAGAAGRAERHQVHSDDAAGAECSGVGHHRGPVLFSLETGAEGGGVVRA